MSSRAFLSLAILLSAGVAWARQDTSPLSARTLYYQGEDDDDTKPAKPAPKPKPKPAKPTPVAHAGTAPAATPVSQHLGLRYNILLFDRSTRKAVPVDKDRQFKSDECVQLEFTPNRSGYLYVFEQGTSGKWQVLFPSEMMSDEVNEVRARQSVKIPSNYCFKIGEPSGTEHLFVVLSRNQEDMHALDRAIRARSQGAPAPPSSAPPEPSSAPIMAKNDLGGEIERMRSELGAKDMSIEKIGDEPQQAGEPENAVYVVNASNVSSDRLVSEIQIKHD